MRHHRIYNLLLGVIAVGVLIPTLFQRTYRQDLDIVLVAAQNLSHYLPVYVLNDNPHTKPPLMTLLMIPFTYFQKEWLFRCWDLLNVVTFLFLAYQFNQRLRLKSLNSFALVIVVGLCLNQWNGEIRFGQFNLLMFAGVVLLTWNEKPILLGAFLSVAVLFKPTNLFLMFWALLSLKTERWKTLFSFLGGILLLIFIYILEFGWPSFLQDHQTWKQFVDGPIASSWMGDLDGLSTWLFRVFGWSPSFISRILMILGISLSFWMTWFIKDPVVSSAWMGFLLAVLSPLPFKHNYVLLVGFYSLALHAISSTQHKKIKWLVSFGLFLNFVAFQVYSPTTFHWKVWSLIQPPTLGFYASTILAFIILSSRGRIYGTV
ncbi:MAG: DUF2029 domain-containing protein [Proteobacteria bacterium]|nr:DUF2029 domain-containing protein [Pseudomonadota bacterium]NDD04470.1 DUF2029 domain-containing protein [Pseudomonadota bacterium]NDG27563.1 DUF2029 domain-containing protein [Pseudomonadota bacterium]